MALITSIEEFKQYIPADINMSIETMLPFIEEAEQLYIVPLLGSEFYEAYKALYLASGTTPLSDERKALLPYIQRPLAYYAQLQSMVHLAVTYGDMGIRQHRSEESDAAPRWLQEKLQFQALRNGDIHSDKLLAFLEENATNSNDYALWFSSSANTINSGTIVYSTEIASRHIDINNSRRVFLKLRGKIREIETKLIPKLISQAQYDELVTKLKAGNTTQAEDDLIAKLEPIIAKRALFMQLPFMRVQITENGIFIYSGTDELYKLGQLAGDAEIKVLRHQLMDAGEFGFLSDEDNLRQFILDNIDDYPLIKASPAYTVQPDPGPAWEAPNDPNSNHFAV